MQKYLLRLSFLVVFLSTVFLIEAKATEKTISVSTYKQLKEVSAQAKSGTTILITPGLYPKGLFLKGLKGTPENPIVIAAANPNNPPFFLGNGEGAKLSNCSYVKLSNLVFQGFPKNGINIDDGGKVQNPSHHIILENITVRNIGPNGNNDAMKLSGVDHFLIRNCHFENWGGSAIDLVGCHYGIIEECQILGGEGSRNANGVQIKGGSRFILVQTSIFRNVAERSVNLGGMTGKQYFRPFLTDYEAKDVVLAGNTFIGSESQINWVTSQESHIHHNLFFLPRKWVGRILQETRESSFKPSQKGLFEKNMIVTDMFIRNFFNVGRGTDPDSFVFYGNAWFNPDNNRKPRLPTDEKEGIYGVDPMIVSNPDGFLVANSADPSLKQIGPWSYVPWQTKGEFNDITIPSIPKIE